MKPSYSRSIPAWALSVLLVAAELYSSVGPVRADDWLQFRRDERRTAASRDRLQLPLTDIWTVPGLGLVTWHGRAFYLGPSGEGTALFCVDLRTGAVQWKRPLFRPWRQSIAMPAQQRSPVAVTADGIVYVQDYVPGTASMGAVSSQGVTLSFGRSTQYFFKAFRAMDGGPIGMVASSPNDPPVPQAILVDAVGAPLGRPVNRSMPTLGPSLILGNEVIASGIGDCLFRWAPGSVAGLLSIAHLVPQPGSEPALRVTDLGGFPPASAGSGLVIGGMSSQEPWITGDQSGEKQLLAVMNGGNCLWHRDYPWALGFPTVEKDCILTGVGSGAAERSIMAHDMVTGAVRWVYPPGSLRPDGIGHVSGGGASSGPGGGVFMGSRRFYTADRHAYRSHAGIAVVGGRAYGAVYGEIVSLDVDSGTPGWRWRIPRGEIARSVVLSPGHVIVSLDRVGSKTPQGRLVALRVADGKPEWNQILPSAGDLALSDGLLFLNDGGVHAFAPAERTYRMAVDSPNAADYDPLPGLNRNPLAEMPAVEAPDVEAMTPEQKTELEAKRAKAVADATVVRLYWGDPLEKMLKQLRERQAAAPGLPLLVSLEWLDPTRTTIRGGQSGWSAREIANFAAVCERLAREVSPQHLDLAPEVNVWLSRDPLRLPAVRALLQTAIAAVKKVSPETKVLISLNREVLARRYGRGSYTPFGRVVFPNAENQRAILSLLDQVDEIGLTSLPQSAFTSPLEIPGDYLLGLKYELPQKPLLLTRLAVTWEKSDRTPEITQASFLKHVLQATYWINAELVAYPELIGPKQPAGDEKPDVVLGVAGEPRLALAYWRDTLQWKRVSQLSAPAAQFDTMPPR